jgi:tRNA pseudouridine38-40 synthase
VAAGQWVGGGKPPATWPAEVLAAGVRDPGVPVAPAHGLTLEEVGYPEEDELVAQAERARGKRELG